MNHYNFDFDFDENFRNLIELTCVYSTNVQNSLNEKFLNYKKVMTKSYAKIFKKIINIEMLIHKKMNIYIRMKRYILFFEIKILSSRMIYKIQKNLKKQILKFKIRWCVKNFEQSYEINFHNIYVSIIKFMLYKILFIIIVKYDFETKQMNIVTIFLNALLKKIIYIESSKNYEKS